MGNTYFYCLITFVLLPNNNNKGGGSAGTNTLYQLAKRNVKAVLLERAQLTAGTTWHTAGLGLFHFFLIIKTMYYHEYLFNSLETSP